MSISLSPCSVGVTWFLFNLHHWFPVRVSTFLLIMHLHIHPLGLAYSYPLLPIRPFFFLAIGLSLLFITYILDTSILLVVCVAVLTEIIFQSFFIWGAAWWRCNNPTSSASLWTRLSRAVPWITDLSAVFMQVFTWGWGGGQDVSQTTQEVYAEVLKFTWSVWPEFEKILSPDPTSPSI